jgi:hypothetical protein
LKLLANGNTKLGTEIGAWSIPSLKTCPGKSSLCSKLCYAGRYEHRLHIDYSPKLAASKCPDFIGNMVSEARLRRIVRVHVSGDFYSQEYIRTWAEIAKRCPGTQFYVYTRSWRDKLLMPALRALGAMPNFKVLFSCDKETGIPEGATKSQLVWMATDDTDVPPVPVLMVFRVKRSSVMAKMAGSTVCPKENGLVNAVTCGRCQLCFK